MALVPPPVRQDAPSQRRDLDPEGRLHEVPWHSQTVDEVRKLLRTEPTGLSTEEARQRLDEFGANTLPAPDPPSLLSVFLHQFASPLIYILLIAGGVALAMQDYKDAIFIFAVVLLNAAIGTYQEFRAEKKAHALQVMLKIQATALRDGDQVTISAEDLVPGDVVLLESGGKVPADLRLISATNLAIDESFLTGESLPVDQEAGRRGRDDSGQRPLQHGLCRRNRGQRPGNRSDRGHRRPHRGGTHRRVAGHHRVGQASPVRSGWSSLPIISVTSSWALPDFWDPG